MESIIGLFKGVGAGAGGGPGSQYRRFCRRFGRKAEAKAAFGHTLLVITWHVLHDDVDYVELGPDYLDTRNDSKQRERYLIRQLEVLGHKVTLDPAARSQTDHRPGRSPGG